MFGIDLFAGAGGLSIGAIEAGIEVKIAVEADSYAAETYSYNHPETHIHVEDIATFRKIHLKSSEPLIVFGGPPCQGFSTSNQKTRDIKNSGNWLFQEFIRVIKMYNPEWILFENVRGITTTEKGKFVDIIISEIEKCGYSTNSWLLNASDYGVPQNRTRFFIVGSRDNIAIKKPLVKPGIVKVKDAINDLPILRNGDFFHELEYRTEPLSKYAKQMRVKSSLSKNNYVSKNSQEVYKRYKHIPQGGNWSNIPDELMKNYKDKSRCHTGIYKRLDENKPSVVIGNYRKNMLIHPNQDRGLSVREAARLQSFPDWFVFKGPLGYQQQQVGNAVPPLLAKIVFDEILNAHYRSGAKCG